MPGNTTWRAASVQSGSNARPQRRWRKVGVAWRTGEGGSTAVTRWRFGGEAMAPSAKQSKAVDRDGSGDSGAPGISASDFFLQFIQKDLQEQYYVST